MRGLTLQSHSREIEPVPEIEPRAVLRPPPDGVTVHLGAGAVLYLGGLGIAALATIVAFFGIGLSLLVEQPAPTIRAEPPTAAVGRNPTAMTPHEATAPRKPVAVPEGMAALPHKPGQPAASAAPAGSVAAGVSPPSPSGPSVKPGATPGAATAVSNFQPEPVIPPPAANGAGASLLPGSPPQPNRAIPNSPSAAASPSQAKGTPSASGANTPVAAPKPTVTLVLPAAEITALLTRGDAAFRRGDLTSARQFYQRAFEAGAGRGALGIGASYDPLFLRRFHLWAEPADPTKARIWYLRARDLGASEAEGRLARLKPSPAP